MAAPLIAIVGSYAPERAKELSLKHTELAPEAAVELGRELARQGCHIVVYASYPFLLEVDVVRGYVEVKKTQPEPECIQVRHSLRFDRPEFPEERANREMFLFLPDANPEWEVSFYRSLREVDGVLILGGGPSSMIAGVVSVGHRRPIVACSYFGGYGAKIWELLPTQHTLLEQREISLMADAWDPSLAKRYVEILLRQRQQLAREEQELADESRRREEELRAQYEQQLALALKAEREGRKSTKVYAVVSVLAFVAALATFVVALGYDNLSRMWLLVLLAAAPLAAGVSAATIRVVFDMAFDPQATTGQAPASVLANSAMGLVGGGFTAVLYILTQLIAIGDAVEAKHYVRLIPFALATGFLAGFALDVVKRKLIQQAEGGVGDAYPKRV